MSVKHPIISVTGSSGAGTSSVKKTFERIFRREKITASYIEGDAFHAYDRVGMKEKMAEEADRGNNHFSHFGPDANLLGELENVFRQFAESGTGRTRHYVHDDDEAELGQRGEDGRPGADDKWCCAAARAPPRARA